MAGPLLLRVNGATPSGQIPHWASARPLDILLQVESSDIVRSLGRPLFRLLAEIGEIHPSSTLNLRAAGPMGLAQVQCSLRELPPLGWLGRMIESYWQNRGAFACGLQLDLDHFTLGRWGHTTERERVLAARPPHGVHVMVFRRVCNAGCRYFDWKWDLDPETWHVPYRDEVRAAADRLAARVRDGYRFHQLIAVVGEQDEAVIRGLRRLGLPGHSTIARVSSGEELVAAFRRLG